MIFEALTTIGTFEIKILDGTKVKYTIVPFDVRKMKEVEALGADAELSNVDRILAQIKIFCPEFDESHFEGIPVESLTQMLEYIIETSQGKKRTEAEKKTVQKEPTKS